MSVRVFCFVRHHPRPSLRVIQHNLSRPISLFPAALSATLLLCRAEYALYA